MMDYELFSRFGLRKSWKHADREEIRRFHSRLWRELKVKYLGVTPSKWYGRLWQIPGLNISIKRLLGMGYGQTDIAVMFGISNERMRQLMNKLGLAGHNSRNSRFRIWSDERNCYVPISDQVLGDLLRQTENRKREERKRAEKLARIRRHKEIRRKHVSVLQSMDAESEHPVSSNQLSMRLGHGRSGTLMVLYYWGYSVDRPGSYAKALNRLYRVAKARRAVAGEGNWATGSPAPTIRTARQPGTFSHLLASKRLRMRLTQKEMGNDLGIDPRTYGGHERGLSRPRHKYRPVYAKLLGRSEKELFSKK